MNVQQLNAEIMKRLTEIRTMLIENGGCQYLSMAIHKDQSIEFHNSYGFREEDDHRGLELHGYIRGEE